MWSTTHPLATTHPAWENSSKGSSALYLSLVTRSSSPLSFTPAPSLSSPSPRMLPAPSIFIRWWSFPASPSLGIDRNQCPRGNEDCTLQRRDRREALPCGSEGVTRLATGSQTLAGSVNREHKWVAGEGNRLCSAPRSAYSRISLPAFPSRSQSVPGMALLRCSCSLGKCYFGRQVGWEMSPPRRRILDVPAAAGISKQMQAPSCCVAERQLI